MKRNYVGLACSGHDNALCIVDSRGAVAFAEAAERSIQNKRALNSPPDDLNRIGDLVATHAEPGAELVVALSWSDRTLAMNAEHRRIVEARLKTASRLPRYAFLVPPLEEARQTILLGEHSVAYAGENLVYRCEVEPGHREPRRVTRRYYDHHLTHAAAGCFSSPFDSAVCAVLDGMGEGLATSCFAYVDGQLTPLPRPALLPDETELSLGIFYAELCTWCGFDLWRGEEWKVMGLAPYGRIDPGLRELMRRGVEVRGHLAVQREQRLEALAELRALTRGRDEPPERAAHLARTGQAVYEELCREMLASLHGYGISRDLVLGGGCALNSSWNGRLLRETGFERLHVFSAPADDGNAVGAALLAFREDHPGAGCPPGPLTPYLGSEMSDETLGRLLQYGGIESEADDVVERAAELLAGGAILGWIQGRAEFGPRALGNRSILANPCLADTKDRVNAVVKFREGYRPFAPAVLHEAGPEYFEDYQESPHMERTLRFRPEVRGKVPAVVHVDGTGRLQTVKREWNERFHALIEAFRRRTGIPLLLNTSLNVMGRPIAHSVEDAIGLFFTSGLDALVIGDRLFDKRRLAVRRGAGKARARAAEPARAAV